MWANGYSNLVPSIPLQSGGILCTANHKPQYRHITCYFSLPAHWYKPLRTKLERVENFQVQVPGTSSKQNRSWEFKASLNVHATSGNCRQNDHGSTLAFQLVLKLLATSCLVKWTRMLTCLGAVFRSAYLWTCLCFKIFNVCCLQIMITLAQNKRGHRKNHTHKEYSSSTAYRCDPKTTNHEASINVFQPSVTTGNVVHSYQLHSAQ